MDQSVRMWSIDPYLFKNASIDACLENRIIRQNPTFSGSKPRTLIPSDFPYNSPPLSLSIIIRFEQFWAPFHLIFRALPDSYTRLHPKTGILRESPHSEIVFLSNFLGFVNFLFPCWFLDQICMKQMFKHGIEHNCLWSTSLEQDLRWFRDWEFFSIWFFFITTRFRLSFSCCFEFLIDYNHVESNDSIL